MKPLHGRVAIVTGAAQGIGPAIAVKLAEQGAELALVDQRVSSETADEIGRPAMSLVVDVSSDDGWARMAKDVERGRVAELCNWRFT